MTKKPEVEKDVVVGGVEGESNAPTEPSVPAEKKNTVPVDRSVLEQILANQKKLDETIANQAKTIEMLRSVADKGRLAKFEEQNRGTQLVRRAKVGVWRGDVILGFTMVKDEVGFENGVLKENQVIRVYLDKGKGKEPVPTDLEYLFFYRNLSRLEGEVIREARSSTGETRTIKLDDGREFELDVRFINL